MTTEKASWTLPLPTLLGGNLVNLELWLLIVWRTKTHLLWLIGAGAVLGALGLV